MNQPPIIEAGNDLAAFATDCARAYIQVSGDAADGKYPLTLAKSWDKAVIATHPSDIGFIIGKVAGRKEGTALREEILDLATIVLDGFTAALELTGDPDDCGGEERSMPEIETAIAAALAASSRLHALILEDGGQTKLPLPKNTP